MLRESGLAAITLASRMQYGLGTARPRSGTREGDSGRDSEPGLDPNAVTARRVRKIRGACPAREWRHRLASRTHDGRRSQERRPFAFPVARRARSAPL
jgi:hypothetical protein